MGVLYIVYAASMKSGFPAEASQVNDASGEVSNGKWSLKLCLLEKSGPEQTSHQYLLLNGCHSRN